MANLPILWDSNPQRSKPESGGSKFEGRSWVFTLDLNEVI